MIIGGLRMQFRRENIKNSKINRSRNSLLNLKFELDPCQAISLEIALYNLAEKLASKAAYL